VQLLARKAAPRLGDHELTLQLAQVERRTEMPRETREHLLLVLAERDAGHLHHERAPRFARQAEDRQNGTPAALGQAGVAAHVDGRGVHPLGRERDEDRPLHAEHSDPREPERGRDLARHAGGPGLGPFEEIAGALGEPRDLVLRRAQLLLGAAYGFVGLAGSRARATRTQLVRLFASPGPEPGGRDGERDDQREAHEPVSASRGTA
jgi:hypothetical protein